MRTEKHAVHLEYTRRELMALFAVAEQEDVEKGGRYNRKSAAINVWSHSWINEATRHDSDTIGSFYVRWGDTSYIYLIECDEAFAQEDLLYELATLETKALGYLKHGRDA